ncbi:MAG: hypothetical protein CMF12_13565 [Idiomarina sp.]|uniref:HipA N-terminal domain-containing protein n=1 Tax=Idiomarina sp. TaxID=1874361 RepID=UPI000C3AB0D7|nr:hypothetical protein [Idiomarina sp.]
MSIQFSSSKRDVIIFYFNAQRSEYFDNLLPEGLREIRDRIVDQDNADSTRPFDILAII